MNKARDPLIKRWRKVKNKNGARLFWRNRRSRLKWDTDEVAQIVDGVVTFHFYTLEALDNVLREIWETQG